MASYEKPFSMDRNISKVLQTLPKTLFLMVMGTMAMCLRSKVLEKLRRTGQSSATSEESSGTRKINVDRNNTERL